MGNVHSLSKPEELGDFYDFIYGDEDGYAYSPTKDPVTDEFEKYFFHWPSERSELIQHALTHAPTKEVYFGTTLFQEPNRATKENFKGSWIVWAEFDGKVPGTLTDIPQPTLKIKSSTDGHEHWYWKLNAFETDPSALEGVTKRLAYALGADMAAWNTNRVLRPPGTMHHESQRMVYVLRWDQRIHDIDTFRILPEIPIPQLQVDDVGKLPPVVKTIAKHQWDDDEFDFFMKDVIPTGQRSSALTRLAHDCIEMKMSNEETLAILIHADNRWKKFSNRNDQRERLIGVINYVRSQHPVDPVEEEVSERLAVYTYEEFINTEINLEWVVPDLIHKKGVLALMGPRGVGKSQLSLRFAERMATGSSFLKWKIDKPIKTLFVSMEMPHEELLYIMRQMKMQGSEGLNQNMMLMPVGGSLRLNNPKAQAQLNKVIEKYQPEGIFFDSFGKGVGEDLNSETVIFDTMDYIDETIREEYGCFAWFIHHPRKSQVGNKKPNTVDDMYGNAYFGNAVSSVVSLWPNGGGIDVSCLKLRLARPFSDFRIQRTGQLDYVIDDVQIPTHLANPNDSSIGMGPVNL